jgi:nucleotide-binding universal stress UspA family protein
MIVLYDGPMTSYLGRISMRRILLPVDGSRSSASALEYMLERKKRGERARVDVLFVQPAPLVMNKEVANILLEEQLKVFSDRRIAASMKKLSVKPIFITGDPALSIIKYAVSENVDEIVMGTRGRGRIAQVLLGSVAAKVIQLATIPVTLVK